MKRNILRQFCNEWRDNVWLVVEITVVTVVIWVMGMVVLGQCDGYFEPRGFTPEDVYSLTVKTVNENSPEFSASPDGSKADYIGDRNEIIRSLRHHPLVEAVGIHRNGLPYNFNYWGNGLKFPDTDSTMYQGNQRSMSPDMAEVLKLEPLNGLTVSDLHRILEKGESLISPFWRHRGKLAVEDLVGRTGFIGNDTTDTYRVGGLINTVRRLDYEGTFWGGSIILPMQESDTVNANIALRVKPGQGKKFAEAFKSDPTLRRYRNVYVTNLQPLLQIRAEAEARVDTKLRIMAVIAVFLLATIFLGLLGSFWFRMQQRAGEIAIRKVCGATDGDIFRRVLGEGILVWAAAVLLASALLWPFCGKVDEMVGLNWTKILIVELVTVAAVAIGITLSLLWPARKVMHIEPAVAVKEE